MVTLTSTKQVLLKQLATDFQLELLILFGSQVTGKTHAESDFDIGYRSHHPLTVEAEGRLISALMPIVEQHDERAINLVNLRRVTPLLLHTATSQAQVLYQATPITFATLQAFAFKQYLETKPLYRLKAERLGLQLR